MLRNINIYFLENRNNCSMCFIRYLDDLVGILIKKDIWQKRRQKQEIAFLIMVVAEQFRLYTYEQWSN